MSTQKPSHNEEEFVARQEVLTRHKAAVEKSHQMESEERDRRRREHFMKCPKCGMDLATIVFRGVAIDRCDHCEGYWLDRGELELLAGKGGDILSRIIDVFRPGTPGGDLP